MLPEANPKKFSVPVSSDASHFCMQLFYAPGIPQGIYTLPPDEAHHCLHVLRHRQGQTIWVIDGAGGLYKAVITHLSPKECAFTIEQQLPLPPVPPIYIHLAVALTKNADRWEWFAEKAAEIGISAITPLLTDRTERRQLRPDRLQKILITATKQSVKATVPLLLPLTAFNRFIQQPPAENTARYIAYIDDNNQLLHHVYTPGTNVVMLIGPEGDFTPDEAQQAIAAGFVPVSLGKSRLRTETAAITVCHTFNLLNQT